jgi:hypothetical protein
MKANSYELLQLIFYDGIEKVHLFRDRKPYSQGKHYVLDEHNCWAKKIFWSEAILFLAKKSFILFKKYSPKRNVMYHKAKCQHTHLKLNLLETLVTHTNTHLQ